MSWLDVVAQFIMVEYGVAVEKGSPILYISQTLPSSITSWFPTLGLHYVLAHH